MLDDTLHQPYVVDGGEKTSHIDTYSNSSNS